MLHAIYYILDLIIVFVLRLLFYSLIPILLIVLYLIKKHNLVYVYLHKVDKESSKHGGELVAEVLKSHGVNNIFTLVGGHISPILVAAEKQDIRVIDTRHEVSAVFAADAVARLSGVIGVAVVTAGPGVTNTITAVKNAQMAESPVLILGGAAATILKGRGALQDIDQLSLFKPLCKFCETVTTVRDIVPVLRNAIHHATSNTPGPAFVELPIDVLYPYKAVRDQMGIKSSGNSLGQKVVNWYLQSYLANLFAGAWDGTDYEPIPPVVPIASLEKIQKCVEILSKAKRPILIIGSQATLPPVPIEDLREAVEELGIPCFLGGMARGLLGKNSPIQMKHRRKEALKEADVVILAGAVCDFRLSYGRILNRQSKIICVNRSKSQLYKNSDIYWKPTEAVTSDVASFLVNLNTHLSDYKCDRDWIANLRNKENEKEEKNRQMAKQSLEEHLNPLKVLQTLDEILDENAILVADGGDFVGTAAYTLRPTGPLQWLDPGAFGTLGVGGGFALGAKVCRPDSEIWLIYGDGSCGYSIAEFDTFKRHSLPVIAVVGNDAGWTQIAREQVPMLGSNVACELLYTNYDKVAEGYGGKGLLVTKDDAGRLDQVFVEAQALNRQGHSVLINVLIGKSEFREGSISV